jgi:hypothetical protein
MTPEIEDQMTMTAIRWVKPNASVQRVAVLLPLKCSPLLLAQHCKKI